MDSYAHFKKIRNQIRKLDILSLVNVASKKIREIEYKRVDEWKGFLPWRLLLLIKWGFEFGGENYPLQTVDGRMLVKLMNMLHEFEGAEPNLFLEYKTLDGIQKFLRTISFQQFWLQNKLGYWVIARQKVLFCELPINNPIHITFKHSMNGIVMGDFLELSFLLWSWVSGSSRNLVFQPAILFKNFEYPTEDVVAFCSAISRTPIDLRSFLFNRKRAIENPYFQLTESSPLKRYPVLNLKNGYLVYSQKLLEEMISTLFYDVVKAKGGNDLAMQFSFILERYIERGLGTLNLEYFVEKRLYQVFPNQNVTDFLIPLKDFTLMIEVKAVELRPIVKVYPNNQALKRELTDSIIKGTIQGFSLANSIRLGRDPLIIPSRSNFFLMIVTYRDLFLGDGDLAWNEFLKDAIEPVLKEKGISLDLIPPEQIIILSVDEFDDFISVLWQGLATIPDIFNHMLELNKSWETKKWQFSQYLDKFRNENPKHPFLDDEFELLTKTIRAKFREK